MNRLMLTVGAMVLLGIGAAQAADAQAGKVKAAACAGCHGVNGEGMGSNPALAGISEAQFAQAMADYKSGKRANAVMKSFASQLNETDTANVAAYYASLKK